MEMTVAAAVAVAADVSSIQPNIDPVSSPFNFQAVYSYQLNKPYQPNQLKERPSSFSSQPLNFSSSKLLSLKIPRFIASQHPVFYSLFKLWPHYFP
jgi:hypothetical protein